ncbi:MAG: type II CAAX endopeptidase family protein [Bacteroidota bacterium]
MKLLKYFFSLLLYVIAMELSAIWIFIPNSFNIEYSEFFDLIQALIQLLIVLGFFFIAHRIILKTLFKIPKIKWTGLASLIGLSFAFLQTPLKLAYNYIMGTEYHIIYDFNGFENHRIQYIISTILVIPIAEELFFRGFIQNKMHEEFKPITTVVMTSLLFALLHAPYTNIVYAFYEVESQFLDDWHLSYITFFGGLISGFFFFKTKSIIPSITFHMCWNLMATLV